MKRLGDLMPGVYTFSNLVLAARKAAKGKKRSPSTARFLMDLEPELFKLQRELSNGTWKPGPYGFFTIHDPKERSISVAPFRDRVVHHAMINILAPCFERRFDFDSYGCRKGKGMDLALKRAQSFASNKAYFLKTDIRKFFASVDHEILRHQLCNVFKDKHLLAVLDRIIDSSEEGLPLGNLTSQWMANFYLTPFDRFLRVQSETLGQVRYMDDVLVFGKSRRSLDLLLPKVKAFLSEMLRLGLKEKMTTIHPAWAGIPFLGFRVLPTELRLRRETWKRFRARLRRREWEFRSSKIEMDRLVASVRSMLAHLERGSTRGLRRQSFRKTAERDW